MGKFYKVFISDIDNTINSHSECKWNEYKTRYVTLSSVIPSDHRVKINKVMTLDVIKFPLFLDCVPMYDNKISNNTIRKSTLDTTYRHTGHVFFTHLSSFIE